MILLSLLCLWLCSASPVHRSASVGRAESKLEVKDGRTSLEGRPLFTAPTCWREAFHRVTNPEADAIAAEDDGVTTFYGNSRTGRGREASYIPSCSSLTREQRRELALEMTVCHMRESGHPMERPRGCRPGLSGSETHRNATCLSTLQLTVYTQFLNTVDVVCKQVSREMATRLAQVAEEADKRLDLLSRGTESLSDDMRVVEERYERIGEDMDEASRKLLTSQEHLKRSMYRSQGELLEALKLDEASTMGTENMIDKISVFLTFIDASRQSAWKESLLNGVRLLSALMAIRLQRGRVPLILLLTLEGAAQVTMQMMSKIGILSETEGGTYLQNLRLVCGFARVSIFVVLLLCWLWNTSAEDDQQNVLTKRDLEEVQENIQRRLRDQRKELEDQVQWTMALASARRQQRSGLPMGREEDSFRATLVDVPGRSHGVASINDAGRNMRSAGNSIRGDERRRQRYRSPSEDMQQRGPSTVMLPFQHANPVTAEGSMITVVKTSRSPPKRRLSTEQQPSQGQRVVHERRAKKRSRQPLVQNEPGMAPIRQSTPVQIRRGKRTRSLSEVSTLVDPKTAPGGSAEKKQKKNK